MSERLGIRLQIRFSCGHVVGQAALDVDRRHDRPGSGSAANGRRCCFRHHRENFGRFHHVGRTDLFIDVIGTAHTARQRRKCVRGPCHKEERNHGRRRREHAARSDPVLKNLTAVVDRIKTQRCCDDRRKLSSGAHQREQIHHRKNGHPKLNPNDHLEIFGDHRHAESAHDKKEGQNRRDRVDKAFKEGHERSNRRHEQTLFCCPLRVSLLDRLIEHHRRRIVPHVVVKTLGRTLVNRFEKRKAHVVASGNLTRSECFKRIRDLVV